MDTIERQRAKKRLERFAWYLDNSIPIPGLEARIGIDGLIGLLPGIGDTLGALLSSYLLGEAARLGAPKSVLLKMAFNIALDALVGTIPVLGDLFDFVWKANQRNAELLNQYLDRPRKTVVSSRIFAWILAVALIGLVIFIGWLGYLVIRALWAAATGG